MNISEYLEGVCLSAHYFSPLCPREARKWEDVKCHGRPFQCPAYNAGMDVGRCEKMGVVYVLCTALFVINYTWRDRAAGAVLLC